MSLPFWEAQVADTFVQTLMEDVQSVWISLTEIQRFLWSTWSRVHEHPWDRICGRPQRRNPPHNSHNPTSDTCNLTFLTFLTFQNNFWFFSAYLPSKPSHIEHVPVASFKSLLISFKSDFRITTTSTTSTTSMTRPGLDMSAPRHSLWHDRSRRLRRGALVDRGLSLR